MLGFNIDNTWAEIILICILLVPGFISTFVLTVNDPPSDDELIPVPEPPKKKKKGKEETEPAPSTTTSWEDSDEGTLHKILWSFWLDLLHVPWYASFVVWVPEWAFPSKGFVPNGLENHAAEVAAFTLFLSGAIWFGKRYTHLELRMEIFFIPLFLALHYVGAITLGELLSRLFSG